MKKLFLLLFAMVGISAAHAQSISIKSDGTVEDSHRNTIGYMKSDGTVEDSHRNTIGYIKSDGTIEDSHRNTIGYVKSDGTVEDSHRSTLGHSRENRQMTAATYFFFKN